MTIFLCLHRFRPTIVTCPIPYGSKPNFVSMDTEESPWKLTHNLMKVQYNSLEKPTRNFTMCLAPMHGIPITPVNLVQYFEFNILLGADTFIVYNYSMNVNSLKRILMYYQKKGIVKLVQWSLPPRLNKTVWYYAQISMLNDCLYRNRGLSRYIVNTDLDEFIVPLKQRGWGDFVSKAGPACEYEVRNVALKGSACNPGEKTTNSTVCSSVFQRPILSTYLFKHGDRSKFILRTDCETIVRIHFTSFPEKYSKDIKGLTVKFIGDTDALVLHYGNISKLFKNNIGRNTTILNRYLSDLKTNMKTSLTAVKLY